MGQERIFMIKIYTDGACQGNPGPAGIGIVILLNNRTHEYSEYIGDATNNIAELTAVSRALDLINDHRNMLKIYTDSQYVVGLFSKNNRARKNISLVNSIKRKIDEFDDVQFHKVRAHRNDYYNNIADQLAVGAIENKE